MRYEHKPVMLEECIASLNIDKDGIYIDGTLGGAGHATEIIRRLDKGTLIGIDQDADAIEASGARLSQIRKNAGLILVRGNFRHMADLVRQCGFDKVDGILLDIGVSSHQLDEAERGFSYQNDAPLDMRMDRDQELNAATIVNTYDEEKIRKIIREYGEEKWAARIASFIAAARAKSMIETTGQLAEIVKAPIPAKARRDARIRQKGHSRH